VARRTPATDGFLTRTGARSTSTASSTSAAASGDVASRMAERVLPAHHARRIAGDRGRDRGADLDVVGEVREDRFDVVTVPVRDPLLCPASRLIVRHTARSYEGAAHASS
jgi:hypothetical protein